MPKLTERAVLIKKRKFYFKNILSDFYECFYSSLSFSSYHGVGKLTPLSGWVIWL